MSKILKRTFALALALALVLSLAACGGNGGTNNGGAVGNNGASSADAFDTDAFIASIPSELKGTKIQFLNWYDPYDYGQEGEVIDAFEAATGIDVEVIVVEYGSQYNERLAGLVATGSSPDVYALDKPRAAYMKSAQPIVNATGYDFSDKAWNTAVKELYSVDGVQYAANLSYTPFKRMQVMYYNTQVMEENGYDDPWQLYKEGKWTWQKFYEMCADWVKQGTDYYGCTTACYSMVAETQGIDFVKYNGKQWEMNLYDTDVLDAWKWTLEKKSERILVQDNAVFDAAKPTALFSTSNTAGLEAKSTWVSKLKKYGYFAAAPMPAFEGKTYYAPVSELNAFAVPIGAKNAKAVPYFISYFCNLAKYNIDEYYYDEQSKEVMTELLGIENQYVSMSQTLFDFEANPFSWNLFNNGTAAQINTFVQSMEYQCQDKLNQMNDVLTNMQK